MQRGHENGIRFIKALNLKFGHEQDQDICKRTYKTHIQIKYREMKKSTLFLSHSNFSV